MAYQRRTSSPKAQEQTKAPPPKTASSKPPTSKGFASGKQGFTNQAQTMPMPRKKK